MASTATTAAPLGAASDGQLVQQHLDGRREAFEVLYGRYFRRLVWLLSNRTSGATDAEDLAQETLLRALRHADRFDTSAPMWPWLKTIALRLAIDNANRKSSGELPCSFDADDGMPEPSDDRDLVRLVEADQHLVAAFHRLTGRHQVALRLRYLEGWSREDAAAFLDVNLNAFDQLIHRASTRIRAEYEKLLDGGRAALGLLPLGGLLDRWRRFVVRVRSRYAPVEIGVASGAATPDAVVTAFVALAVAVGGVAAAATIADHVGESSAVNLASATPDAEVEAIRFTNTPTQDNLERATRNAVARPAPAARTRERHYSLNGSAAPAGSLLPSAEASSRRDEDRATLNARIAKRLGPYDPGVESVTEIPCDGRSVVLGAICLGYDVVDSVLPHSPIGAKVAGASVEIHRSHDS